MMYAAVEIVRVFFYFILIWLMKRPIIERNYVHMTFDYNYIVILTFSLVNKKWTSCKQSIQSASGLQPKTLNIKCEYDLKLFNLNMEMCHSNNIVAVAQMVDRSSSNWKVPGSNLEPTLTCRSVLEQDTEPQIAYDPNNLIHCHQFLNG